MQEYIAKCSCGKYFAFFDNQWIARTAAELHVMLGPQHVVTCTKKEHNQNVAANHTVFVMKHTEVPSTK